MHIISRVEGGGKTVGTVWITSVDHDVMSVNEKLHILMPENFTLFQAVNVS